MRIPEIADRLRDLAAERGLPELAGLADELRRRPAQRAPARSRPMSNELAAEIRILRANNPRMSQADIAKLLGCNQGRISEVLKGKRA
jgi:transcriptional regulator with XRE-family HTH domain